MHNAVVGRIFWSVVFRGKPSSEDLMRVHFKFLVFLETLEGVTEWSISRPERAKDQNKGQTMTSLYERIKTQEILSIPQDWLHLEVRRAAWSDLHLWAYNHQSRATVEGLWSWWKNHQCEVLNFNCHSAGCIRNKIDDQAKWAILVNREQGVAKKANAIIRKPNKVSGMDFTSVSFRDHLLGISGESPMFYVKEGGWRNWLRQTLNALKAFRVLQGPLQFKGFPTLKQVSCYPDYRWGNWVSLRWNGIQLYCQSLYSAPTQHLTCTLRLGSCLWRTNPK